MRTCVSVHKQKLGIFLGLTKRNVLESEVADCLISTSAFTMSLKETKIGASRNNLHAVFAFRCGGIFSDSFIASVCQ